MFPISYSFVREDVMNRVPPPIAVALLFAGSALAQVDDSANSPRIDRTLSGHRRN